MRKGYLGLHTHRFKDNPEEKRFADAWAYQDAHGKNLAHLLDNRPIHQGMPPAPSVRDQIVAATVIQWLGSPVGQHFLAELGYVCHPPSTTKKSSKKKPKGCDCYLKLSKELEKTNTSIEPVMVFAEGKWRTYPQIATSKLNPKVRQVQKVIPTYCPFCGVKYPE